MKIAIVGAHGTGKTTIVHELFSLLKKKGFNANITPEAARSSPFLLAGERCPEGQMDIFASQIENEMKCQRGHNILVSDRSILDSLMYTKLFFPEQKELIKAMESFAKYFMNSYDCIFKTTLLYNPSEIDDPLRPKDEKLQREADRILNETLKEFYPNFIEIPAGVSAVEFIFSKLNFAEMGGK